MAQEGEPTKRAYADYGRAFTRLGEPFTMVYKIIQVGLQIEREHALADSEDDEPENALEVE